jgi:hypothetical protein
VPEVSFAMLSSEIHFRWAPLSMLAGAQGPAVRGLGWGVPGTLKLF